MVITLSERFNTSIKDGDEFLVLSEDGKVRPCKYIKNWESFEVLQSISDKANPGKCESFVDSRSIKNIARISDLNLADIKGE